MEYKAAKKSLFLHLLYFHDLLNRWEDHSILGPQFFCCFFFGGRVSLTSMHLSYNYDVHVEDIATSSRTDDRNILHCNQFIIPSKATACDISTMNQWLCCAGWNGCSVDFHRCGQYPIDLLRLPLTIITENRATLYKTLIYCAIPCNNTCTYYHTRLFFIEI